MFKGKLLPSETEATFICSSVEKTTGDSLPHEFPVEFCTRFPIQKDIRIGDTISF